MKQNRLKVLVVCSRNLRRSLTAETIFRGDQNIEVRSAGTSHHARHQVSVKDIKWASIIYCMELKHKKRLLQLFGQTELPRIVVAEIEDVYMYMDPELVQILKSEISVLK